VTFSCQNNSDVSKDNEQRMRDSMEGVANWIQSQKLSKSGKQECLKPKTVPSDSELRGRFLNEFRVGREGKLTFLFA